MPRFVISIYKLPIRWIWPIPNVFPHKKVNFTLDSLIPYIYSYCQTGTFLLAWTTENGVCFQCSQTQGARIYEKYSMDLCFCVFSHVKTVARSIWNHLRIYLI